VSFWDRFKRKPVSLAQELDRERAPRVVRPEFMLCPKCRFTVNSWRRYANGSILCVPCADKRK
jgi:formylmethanofuran dehydrogenase subunit E